MDFVVALPPTAEQDVNPDPASALSRLRLHLHLRSHRLLRRRRRVSRVVLLP